MWATVILASCLCGVAGESEREVVVSTFCGLLCAIDHCSEGVIENWFPEPCCTPPASPVDTQQWYQSHGGGSHRTPSVAHRLRPTVCENGEMFLSKFGFALMSCFGFCVNLDSLCFLRIVFNLRRSGRKDNDETYNDETYDTPFEDLCTLLGQKPRACVVLPVRARERLLSLPFVVFCVRLITVAKELSRIGFLSLAALVSLSESDLCPSREVWSRLPVTEERATTAPANSVDTQQTAYIILFISSTRLRFDLLFSLETVTLHGYLAANRFSPLPLNEERKSGGGAEMARLLLSFPAIDAGVGALSSDWWEDINDSVKWQDGIFFALCAVYALVSSVALIQLIRIEVRVPEYGWTTQKVFHLMNFIVNGVRAVVFGFHKQVFFLHLKALTSVLLDLPDLLFFSTYALLVLFWAEIYHQAKSLPTDKLRIFYISINGVIYFIQFCIWVYLGFDENNIVQFIGKIFIAVVSFLAALGFLVYGGRLFFMLRRFPIESKGRRKKLHEVGSVTAICFTCFLIRCFVEVLSAIDSDASLDVMYHPVLNLIYYMVVEILPSALVLFILRKLPPKRVSAQYHVIS
ncbi:hypothetical protein C2S51_036912 [Perilla frutescens var. frutescens]|nr:hypothetical protein C2S51_036912 [Perilla frutescens var. frutescens]